MAEEVVLTDQEKKDLALKSFGGKKLDETPAGKTAEEIVAEKKLEDEKVALELKKKEEEELAEKNKQIQSAKVELTDEELLELASKKAGRKITSWDDLKLSPTEEDKKKEQENRDSAKLTYGLKKGIFTKQQYEGFISDSKDPKDLVYSRELALAKEDDTDWTEEKEKEFKEEFEEKFGLNLDSTASKHKRGKKQLLMIADNILKSEYQGIYALDSEFDKFETEQNNRKAQEQKILATAPIYKKDAEEVIASFGKIEVDLGGEKYEVVVPEKSIQSLTEIFLGNEFTSSQILKGYTKEELKEVAHQYILANSFQDLAFEAAKKYREKHEKGVRGIPTGGKLEKPADQYESLTENQKKAIDMFKGVNTSTAVPN